MTELAKLSQIPDGGALRVEADGNPIALFRMGDQVHAINAVCIHRGGPLDEGELEDGVVTCPWHGWQYDVRTGKCINTGETVECYPVEVREGAVFLAGPAQGKPQGA
jgi:nitrite reductase (NADH) small subunit